MSDLEQTQPPPPEFEQTWSTVGPQLEGVEDPTVSLRALDVTQLEDGQFDLDMGTLPLLSVADDTGPDVELTRQKLLGKGGMGQVDLAIQRSLRREVALKSAVADEEGSKAQALLDEARVTGLLEHPNIVPVHQLGRSDSDLPLLVMKRVEGVSWKALIKDAEHPHWKALGEDRLREHVGILLSVCNALEFAHAKGVLHRDVKTDNVMVGAFGEVYLLDWGLALRLDERTPSKAITGTPAYMAPEMLEGTGDLDERTDVYLLGATLHMALTGTTRHQGSSLANVCYSVFRSEPIDYPPDVPVELAELCNRATHADPAERPQSVAAFRLALERYLEHRSSIDLASETLGKLAELRELLSESDPDRERLAGLSAECRFGFGQALRGWPENAVARDGLQECLTLLIERALAAGDLGLAESLLPELPGPADGLRDRVAALRAEQAAKEARLRELETAGDWTQSAAARLVFFFVLLGIGVAVWLWANDGSVRVERTHTPAELATSVSLVFGVLAVMIFLGRKQLLTNQVNTRLTYGALVTGAALVLGRLLNLFDVPPTARLVSSEILLSAYGCAMGGLLLAPWLWLLVPIWVAGAFTARLVPAYAGLSFAISSLLALSLGAWKLHQHSRRADGD